LAKNCDFSLQGFPSSSRHQGFESNAFRVAISVVVAQNFYFPLPFALAEKKIFPVAIALALVLNFTLAVADAVSLLLVAVSQKIWKTYFFIL